MVIKEHLRKADFFRSKDGQRFTKLQTLELFLEEGKILENLNISVHNGESENLYRVLVIFMPSGGTELKGNFAMEVSA